MNRIILIAVILLTSLSSAAQIITRGPYLQKGSDTAITIRWRTDVSTQSEVDFGLTQGTLNQTKTDAAYTTEHELRIEGLNPATTYYYQIGDLNSVLMPAAADLTFKTHPTVGSSDPIKFWVLGDCGTANNNQRNVRNAYYNYVGSDHTDGILFLGDNAYTSGTDEQYQNAIFENMYEDKLKNTIAWSTLGNHDGYTGVSSNQTGPYYDIFSFPQYGESGGLPSGTEAYYSFDYGNIHFICLESYETDRSVGAAMYNWCKNDIQNTTQEWIVAFWHHPPYTKGSHDSDTETELIQMRENFLPMLENNGVDLVLSGHSHSYERSYFINGHYGNSDSYNSNSHAVGNNGDGNGKVDQDGSYKKFLNGETANDGAVYITAGSSGKTSSASFGHEAMYYSVSDLGSCVIEVDGSKMDVKFIRETGSIDDYFTIEKDTIDCIAGAPCDDGNPTTSNDVYNENCECLGFQSGGSVCIGINSGGDDVEENGNDGSMYTNSSDIEIVNDGNRGDQTIGLRFNNVQVPSGSTITGAYIQFVKDGNTTGTANALIKAQASSNAPAMGSAAYYLSNVTKTNNSVSWSIPSWNGGATALDQRTPNLAAIVQELIDSNGFNYGNSMLFTMTGSGTRRALSYNDVPGSAAQLCITYTSSGCTIDGPCSDGDPCTVGETFDANCLCNGGTPAPDADGDGVCDALDQCSSLDDNLIGTACDDGNPCTVGEYYSSDCGCTGGVFQDSDNDGVCNANDTCYDQDDNISGQSCNDNDPCTINDEYNEYCLCEGTLTTDSDSDGVCDALDQCPGQDDSLIGSPCNDGDNCTVNDILTVDCQCEGTFLDSDNDGVCNFEDQCPTLNNNLIGQPCSDGDPCTSGETYDTNCGCTGGVYSDSDSDGVCDGLDQCPGFDNDLIGTSCDDNDPCTINDIYGSDCNCSGTAQDSDNDGVCDLFDQCPGLNDNLIGQPCSDGDPCTEGETYNSNCGCDGGVFADADSDGVCDAQDQCPGLNDNLTGTSCDDGDDCTTNDVYDDQCGCAGTIVDSDNDGVCDAEDSCPGFNDNFIGQACNDGDPCTTGETFDNACGCTGGVGGDDSDNDGICDGLDECPGADDSLMGLTCDDGDENTFNDMYDENCVCVGESTEQSICLTIASSIDDAEESNSGDIDLESTDLEFVNDVNNSTGNQTIGLRYTGVSIPSGSTILDATIQFTVDETGLSYTALTVRAEDIDDSPAFNEDANNITDRSTTSSGVNWFPGWWLSEGDRGSAQRIPNVTGMIQEVIDRPGYSEGNALSFIITGTGIRVAESFDGQAALAPELCVTFSPPPCIAGESCEDGDPCTTGETYDANCDCLGGVFQDSDDDGICDANETGCVGDINMDGTVDIDDFLDLNTMFGLTCTDCPEDLTGDGIVNVNDFLQLNSVYGTDCSVSMILENPQMRNGQSLNPILVNDLSERRDINVNAELHVLMRKMNSHSLYVYPNPNRGQSFNLQLVGGVPDEQSLVSVTDLSGKEFYSNKWLNRNQSNSTLIRFERPLAPGVYILRMTSDKRTMTDRFIVE